MVIGRYPIVACLFNCLASNYQNWAGKKTKYKTIFITGFLSRPCRQVKFDQSPMGGGRKRKSAFGHGKLRAPPLSLLRSTACDSCSSCQSLQLSLPAPCPAADLVGNRRPSFRDESTAHGLVFFLSLFVPLGSVRANNRGGRIGTLKQPVRPRQDASDT